MLGLAIERLWVTVGGPSLTLVEQMVLEKCHSYLVEASFLAGKVVSICSS